VVAVQAAALDPGAQNPGLQALHLVDCSCPTQASIARAGHAPKPLRARPLSLGAQRWHDDQGQDAHREGDRD
jgi:hypothetical protein